MRAEQFRLNADLEDRHWWFLARRRIVQRLVAAVLDRPPEGGGRPLVVDVGCGTGANLAALSATCECVGIDPAIEAVALARQRFPQVRFLCGHAPADLGEVASRADLFLLTDVLEHVADDFRFFSELAAAAGPGAVFLITVPADMALWSMHDESHGHYRRYDRARLVRLWEGLPLRTLLVSHYFARVYPLVRLARAVSRWRGRAWGAADTDLAMPPAVVNRLLIRFTAGEGRRLSAALASSRARRYRRGVSLLALVRRQAGVIVPRNQPDDIAHESGDTLHR